MTQYAGSGWIAALEESIGMSQLGIAAADLLGDAFLGIYHIDTKQMRRTDWGDKNRIIVPVNCSLCSVDFDHLTRLIVLAHDRMIRVEIQGRAKGWLSLIFTQRNKREGEYHERYPTLEDHAAMLRNHYGERLPSLRGALEIPL